MLDKYECSYTFKMLLQCLIIRNLNDVDSNGYRHSSSSLCLYARQVRLSVGINRLTRTGDILGGRPLHIVDGL